MNRQWMRKLSRILCEPVEGGTEDAGRVVWVSCLGPVSSVSVEHYSRFLLGGKKGRGGSQGWIVRNTLDFLDVCGQKRSRNLC